MFQDIIRLTVQRIFNDKILLGLLIVCLLGFFVGGFNHKDEPPVATKDMETTAPPANGPRATNPSSNGAAPPVAGPSSNGAAPPVAGPSSNGSLQQHQATHFGSSNYAKTAGLSPSLAVDFVKWWMKAAMDYSQQSAAQSHEAASNWMSPEAYKAFTDAFWTSDLAQQVCSGTTVAAFQPISVQAEAVNPDHSVVVGLTGTLVLQAANQHPVSSQIQIDVLVRKGDTGLRITGVNNRINTLSPSVY
jgi:hypothetical protein